MTEHDPGQLPDAGGPIGEAARAAVLAERGDTITQPGHAGTLAPVGRGALTPFAQSIEQLLQPYTISLSEWAEALFGAREFAEVDPDETSLAMLAQILTATSSEEALASMELDRAKAMCGDEPGGHSPVLTIFGARPMRSEYEEGPNCYVIVDAVRKADGKPARFTTGARAVQAAILAHVANGWVPFDAILSIRSQRTRRGFYPLNLEAGG